MNKRAKILSCRYFLVPGELPRCPLGRFTVLLLPAETGFLSHATLVLEQSTFLVIVARDFKELEAACVALKFHVAVLGPALGRRMKKALALMIQEKCPEVPIIEMFSESPPVDRAIHLTGEPGPELVKAVKTAIRRCRQKRTAGEQPNHNQLN